jgi:putative secretion ATPase (PEP-CTERM system associated)
MYEVFYNLKAEPFRLSPDHRFCYDHKCYAKARAYMAYAFMRAEGFVMITGRPGTGKTTLIGELIESLADENVKTANLVCTQLQADDLLKVTAYNFGVDHGIVDKGELLQQLGVLLRRWHRDGHRALLIVDEAQDLSESAMEELRLLTNIQESGKPLLQIFLLGQPELRDLVLSPSMEQVHQRIVAASHLVALEKDETEAYIIHRLEKVGWQGDPALSKTIFPLIYKFSEGVPRRINLICSRLFLHGCVEQRHRIGIADLREVIKELQSENLAAGTTFSDDDFQLDDEFYLQVKVEDPDAPSLSNETVNNVLKNEEQDSTPPENSDAAGTTEQAYLHAVGDDVVLPFDVAADRESEKKKDDVIPLRPWSSESGSAMPPPPRRPARHPEEQSPAEDNTASIEQAALNNDSEEDPAQQDSDHHIPITSVSHPAPEAAADNGLKSHPARDEPKAQARYGVIAILIISILTLLLVTWLVIDRDLTSVQAWRDQAGKWWQSMVALVQ